MEDISKMVKDHKKEIAKKYSKGETLLEIEESKEAFLNIAKNMEELI